MTKPIKEAKQPVKQERKPMTEAEARMWSRNETLKAAYLKWEAMGAPMLN